MKWTPEQEQTLRTLWGQGVPTATIAARLGRTRDAINKKSKALGLPPRTRGSVRAAKSEARHVNKKTVAANDPQTSTVVVNMNAPWIKKAQDPGQCGCKAVIGIEGDDPTLEGGADLNTIITSGDPKIGNWRYCGKPVTKINFSGNLMVSNYCTEHAERFYSHGSTRVSRAKAPLKRA